MARHSKHSRRTKRAANDLSLQDQLLATRLDIERTKLIKLKAELPKVEPEYTRWEDLPPPSPEDEARYYEDFKRIFLSVVGGGDSERAEDGNALTSAPDCAMAVPDIQLAGDSHDNETHPDRGAAALGLRVL